MRREKRRVNRRTWKRGRWKNEKGQLGREKGIGGEKSEGWVRTRKRQSRMREG